MYTPLCLTLCQAFGCRLDPVRSEGVRLHTAPGTHPIWRQSNCLAGPTYTLGLNGRVSARWLTLFSAQAREDQHWGFPLETACVRSQRRKDGGVCRQQWQLLWLDVIKDWVVGIMQCEAFPTRRADMEISVIYD